MAEIRLGRGCSRHSPRSARGPDFWSSASRGADREYDKLWGGHELIRAQGSFVFAGHSDASSSSDEQHAESPNEDQEGFFGDDEGDDGGDETFKAESAYDLDAHREAGSGNDSESDPQIERMSHAAPGNGSVNRQPGNSFKKLFGGFRPAVLEDRSVQYSTDESESKRAIPSSNGLSRHISSGQSSAHRGQSIQKPPLRQRSILSYFSHTEPQHQVSEASGPEASSVAALPMGNTMTPRMQTGGDVNILARTEEALKRAEVAYKAALRRKNRAHRVAEKERDDILARQAAEKNELEGEEQSKKKGILKFSSDTPTKMGIGRLGGKGVAGKK